jgi:hypothetical protein
LLLASDGQTKRSTTHSDFTFRGEQLSALLRSHQDEAYLVVTSDNDVLGKNISRISETVTASVMTTGMATFVMYTGSDTTRYMTLSPSGRVEVTITPFPATDKK